MRKVGPRQEEWAPSRAALISTIIFILCWLNHLDVVVLKSCVFCLFKQILPLWSLCISLALSGVSAYSKCSIFIRIVVKILIFISSYHSSSGGKKTSALLWTLYPSLLLTWLQWGPILSTCHQSGPVTLDRSVRCLSRDFSHWNWGERLTPWGQSWEDVSPWIVDSVGSWVRRSDTESRIFIQRKAKQGPENWQNI